MSDQPPGVEIEELGQRGPIAGASTDITAFIGAASNGPTLTPAKVTSWREFQEAFGDYLKPPHYMAHAVRGFFDNGGRIARVIRMSVETQWQAALLALEKLPDVNLICSPDRQDAAAQTALVSHCEKMGDRFAILDSVLGESPTAVVAHRAAVESMRGCAALYYPWIRVADLPGAAGNDTMLIPPSGHVAGLYARSDGRGGVHRPPVNQLVTGAIGVERSLSEEEQRTVGVQGVNSLVVQPASSEPLVRGARTTAPAAETEWHYVNVRRLLIFVEKSIREDIGWAVYEPNDRRLSDMLGLLITEFLIRIWRQGALVGTTPAEAFYVRIDQAIGPSRSTAEGAVSIEVGVAPLRPAEFVVIRFSLGAE